MVPEKIPGRAEYKNPKEEIDSCFEGLPALAILAPLFAPPIDIHGCPAPLGRACELIGRRGTGKTHLLRLLASEVPCSLYELDKERLAGGEVRYAAIPCPEKPAAIIVDDLHYLLKAMHVARLRNKQPTEDAILSKLLEFKTLADRTNSFLIFAADEGPAGLSMRFNGRDNKIAFLNLMGGCSNTADDIQTYFSLGLGKLCIMGTSYKTVDLDYRGCFGRHARTEIPAAVAPRIWPREVTAVFDHGNRPGEPEPVIELNLRQAANLENIIKHLEQPRHARVNFDGPWGICDMVCLPITRFAHDADEKLRAGAETAANKIAEKFGLTDIPLAYLTERRIPTTTGWKTKYAGPDLHTFFPFTSPGRINAAKAFTYESAVARGEWTGDMLLWTAQWWEQRPDTQIAPIRELEVVASAIGGISRAALGMPALGTIKRLEAVNTTGASLSEESGIIYTQNEINTIRAAIKKIFNSEVKYDPESLINRFYYAETDEELLADIVEADLILE
ncbi:MAG: hypothetical protein HYT16_02915 [DPANN group archaeon]|nr:hypothetical protein [DPANN group archaeon]